MSDKLEALKAAALAATPGPWRAFSYRDDRFGIGGDGGEIMVCEHISKDRKQDAVFIAQANPAIVLELLAALKEKDQRIKEFERITEGVDQLAIDGGWTARGMSEYAKARDAENQDLMLTIGRFRTERAELEQRLQQPIKLPKREIGMACEFVSDHIVVSLAALLAEAATAGFKVEVEGE